MRYLVERADVSYAYIEADSPAEALQIAESCPRVWEYELGIPMVIEAEDDADLAHSSSL